VLRPFQTERGEGGITTLPLEMAPDWEGLAKSNVHCGGCEARPDRGSRKSWVLRDPGAEPVPRLSEREVRFG
jgi:hypothetical protein